jgi:hypothetical protein
MSPQRHYTTKEWLSSGGSVLRGTLSNAVRNVGCSRCVRAHRPATVTGIGSCARSTRSTAVDPGRG